MIIEEKTLADKVIYNRVSHIRETINNSLIEKLIEKGATKEEVIIETKLMPYTGCCQQIEVKAYFNKIDEVKKSSKTK